MAKIVASRLLSWYNTLKTKEESTCYQKNQLLITLIWNQAPLLGCFQTLRSSLWKISISSLKKRIGTFKREKKMTKAFDYTVVSKLLAEMRGCVERVQNLRRDFESHINH